MFKAGKKAEIWCGSSDDDINNKLNPQGYVAEIVELRKASPYGKAAMEFDKKNAP
jgi:hypothetical protein